MLPANSLVSVVQLHLFNPLIPALVFTTSLRNTFPQLSYETFLFVFHWILPVLIKLCSFPFHNLVSFFRRLVWEVSACSDTQSIQRYDVIPCSKGLC